MKTLRVAWWFTWYDFNATVILMIVLPMIILGSAIGLMRTDRAEAEGDVKQARAVYSVLAIDVRDEPGLMPVSSDELKFIVGVGDGAESANLLLDGGGVDGLLVVRAGGFDLQYVPVENRPGQSTAGLFSAVGDAIAGAGGDPKKLVPQEWLGGHVQELRKATSALGRMAVGGAWLMFAMLITGHATQVFAGLRGVSSTEVLLSGLGGERLLHVKILEQIFRFVRFWMVTTVLLLVVRGAISELNLQDVALLKGFSDTPGWIIGVGILLAVPYGILVISLGAALGAAAGRFVRTVKGGLMVTLTFGNLIGILFGVLPVITSESGARFVSHVQWATDYVAIFPLSSGGYMMADIVLNNAMPPLLYFAAMVLFIAAGWFYMAALRVFPTSIVDGSLRFHGKKLVGAFLNPWPPSWKGIVLFGKRKKIQAPEKFDGTGL